MIDDDDDCDSDGDDEDIDDDHEKYTNLSSETATETAGIGPNWKVKEHKVWNDDHHHHIHQTHHRGDQYDAVSDLVVKPFPRRSEIQDQ